MMASAWSAARSVLKRESRRCGVRSTVCASATLSPSVSFFSLRDADRTCPDVWYQFGLLRGDCAPKPAFATLRRPVAELSGA